MCDEFLEFLAGLLAARGPDLVNVGNRLERRIQVTAYNFELELDERLVLELDDVGADDVPHLAGRILERSQLLCDVLDQLRHRTLRRLLESLDGSAKRLECKGGCLGKLRELRQEKRA